MAVEGNSIPLIVGHNLIICDDVWFHLNHEIVIPVEEIDGQISLAEVIIKGFKQDAINRVNVKGIGSWIRVSES